MTPVRAKRVLGAAVTYGAIIAATLLLVDGAMNLLGLFPPTANPGDPDLGWRPAAATGRFETDRCTEFSSGESFQFQRNEDGIRTSLSRAARDSATDQVRIGVVGDSQTDLCAPNPQTHPGVLEAELQRSGIPAAVLAYGAGRYSPVQDYLAFRKMLRPYHPAVLVLNIYTGNDFYDILRVDDRPHLARSDTGYTIADPVWYLLDDPATRRRSRVLFALRSLAEKSGIRGFYIRIKELRQLAAAQGKGVGAVLGYLKDLSKAKAKSVGYASAFAAQILNQQLFFAHFPATREESLERFRALAAVVQRENPGLLVLMSPLPSYQLVGQVPVDSALLRTIGRLPITYQQGQAQERGFYEALRSLAKEQGWLFVDNLAELQSYRGSDRLYNNFDYHLLPRASALIGRAEATMLLHQLSTTERIPALNP